VTALDNGESPKKLSKRFYVRRVEVDESDAASGRSSRLGHYRSEAAIVIGRAGGIFCGFSGDWKSAERRAGARRS
jgi:hypothetical protein